ncbi:hypothetical protein F5148DRAFT_981463, partial [Russula earlei]
PRPNTRVLRDIKARQGVADERNLANARNVLRRARPVPPSPRRRSSSQLNSFGRYTRSDDDGEKPAARPLAVGAVSSASFFGLCRCQFRLRALAGELPGVQSARLRGQ